MSEFVYDFEKPILELENQIAALKEKNYHYDMDIEQEVKSLDEKLVQLKKDIYSNLSPWNRVQLARHPQRPYTLDYVQLMVDDFTELHGDRNYGDDKAIVCGLGKFDQFKVIIVGQQKGKNTKENIKRNFGMPHPEGYRKAKRMFLLAEKFRKPVVCFIDTPGAFPGIGAEERGQAEAIATNLKIMSTLKVPIIIVVIGEGASGGALGIGVGDKILMLENSWYSVISPEGCAAILWGDRTKAQEIADSMRLTAKDLLKFGIIDKIIPEPIGGANTDYQTMSRSLKEAIVEDLQKLCEIPEKILVQKRIEKYCKMGFFTTVKK